MMKPDKENEMIFSDAGKCLGCRSCELACALAHGDGGLFDAVASKKAFHSRIRVVETDGHPHAVQCRQCENAPCAMACPTSAIREENGYVVIDEEKCVGCKLCIKACPFGAIAVTTGRIVQEGKKKKRGIAVKCDLCAGLGDSRGRGKQPACVEACPTRALKTVNMEKYRAGLPDGRTGETARPHNHPKL